MRVQVSHHSPLFAVISRIYSDADAFYGYDNERIYDLFEDMDNTALDNLLNVCRRKLPPVNYRDGAFSLGDINDTVLKAALTGKIRPGDMIESVEFHEENEKRQLVVENVTSTEVANILRNPTSYPVDIALYHTDSAESSNESIASESSNESIASGSSNESVDNGNDVWLDLSDNILLQQATDWNNMLRNRLSQMHLLTDLILDKNNIGREGCLALAPLLEDGGSSLKSLSLMQNSIDDDCVSVLVESIKKNNILETLDLDENPAITSIGWGCILSMLCDETSVDCTYLSNHTLRNLGGFLYNHRHQATIRSEISNIRRMLEFNMGPFPARQKIWQVHFQPNGDNLDLTPFFSLNIKLMPRLLAWFSNGRDPSKAILFKNLYHLLRNWNIPELFGIPSAESMRIGSRIAELESKNADLEALLSKLKSDNKIEVSKLKQENQMLKERNKSVELEVSLDTKKRRLS